MIDDDHSVFARVDYKWGGGYEGPAYGSKGDRSHGLHKLYRRFARAIEDRGNVFSVMPTTQSVIDHIGQEFQDGRILIIGAGHARYLGPSIIHTDVALSDGIDCICDAHSLPFPDGYFSGVIAISVFEHVANPWECAEEIRRVVCDRGHVFAVTPFLQPVHMGAHDFTRFTYLGHRRLFRWFDDIESGCAMGPAKSIAYLIPHILANILPFKNYRRVATFVGLVIAWPVKQIDRIIGHREASYDAAAGVFFWGRKRPDPLPDRDIIKLYRGGYYKSLEIGAFVIRHGIPPIMAADRGGQPRPNASLRWSELMPRGDPYHLN